MRLTSTLLQRFVLLTVFLAAACTLERKTGPGGTDVSSVVVSPDTVMLDPLQTYQFRAFGRDAAGDTITVTPTWSATVGAITSNGTYTADTSDNDATVTATVPLAGVTLSATSAVRKRRVIAIDLSPASTSLRTNSAMQFTARGIRNSGDTVSINVTYSATGGAINSSGMFTAGSVPGNYRVIAAYPRRSLADTSFVTVMAIPVASVAVTPNPASVNVGTTVQLAATLTDSSGSILTGRTVTWSSDAPGVATVSANGLVTGVAAGSATITATSEGKSGTSVLTVTSIPLAPVATVTVSPSSAPLRVGATVQLIATLKDSAGNVLTGRAITWSSNATGVATVSASGLVRGIAPGTATITATSEGKNGTATVTVTLVPVASVSLSPNPASVQVGSTVQLAATLRDSAGNVLTGRSVTWSSGTPGLATVSATGLVSGVATGTVTITATSEGKSGTATVTVTAQVTRSGFYVSPSGTSGGDGSSARPWDLQTALSGASGRIQPGDTVWLRAGTYTGHFTSSLSGTSSAPIVVRQYPGERAIIDRNGTSGEPLVVDGSWTIYWGFEVMNSSTVRFGSGLAARPAGVYIRNAANVKLINLIVHDTGHGTYVEASAHNIEIYGWIIFNGGSDNSVRGDGHGIYIRNDGTTPKVVRDNVIFDQFGFGLHGYAEGGDHLDHMVFEGNVVFNAGSLSAFDSPNMILGGVTSATNDTVRNNMFYFSPGIGPRNLRIGYDVSQNGTALFEGNYIVGGTQVVDITYWTDLTLRNNTLIGSGRVLALADQGPTGYTWTNNNHYRDPTATAWREVTTDYTFGGWKQATGLGGSDVANSGTPTQTQVFVRPNQYEPGRAHVVVYNWSGQGTVSVDLSGVLRIGDPYEIRNVQQVLDAPLVSGIYSGGTIAIPMAAVTPTAPIGGSPRAPRATGPDFGVFLVTSGAATLAQSR